MFNIQYYSITNLGHEYPKTATAEDLLDIAFEKGIIPAVTQENVTKPKPENPPEKDWDDIKSEDEDEWHSSIYDF